MICNTNSETPIILEFPDFMCRVCYILTCTLKWNEIILYKQICILMKYYPNVP